MIASAPPRSASLCQSGTASWQSTSESAQSASWSSLEPGKTKTPHLMPHPTFASDPASGRGRRLPCFLPAAGSRKAEGRLSLLDLESKILDHLVRQQLLAHLTYPLRRLFAGAVVEPNLHVLADPNVADLAEAERAKRVLDRLSVWIEHAPLRRHVDLGEHLITRASR